MYSFEIINSAIKNYDLLGKNNIIGTKRIKIITDTFDIHINTLYRWLKKYSDKNLDYNIKSKYNNKKITDEMELFIINSKSINNTFNIKNIKKNIKKKFDIEISKSSIYGVLHKNNLTYKQIKVINNPYNDEQIKEKKDLIKNKINEFDKKIVSQDEMAIYLNDKPSNGWSEKGKDCIIKSKKQLIKTRFSISILH